MDRFRVQVSTLYCLVAVVACDGKSAGTDGSGAGAAGESASGGMSGGSSGNSGGAGVSGTSAGGAQTSGTGAGGTATGGVATGGTGNGGAGAGGGGLGGAAGYCTYPPVPNECPGPTACATPPDQPLSCAGHDVSTTFCQWSPQWRYCCGGFWQPAPCSSGEGGMAGMAGAGGFGGAGGECPAGCEPQESGFCGSEQITWVCSGAFDSQIFRDAGCTDPGTQVPRYCCAPTALPGCP